MMDESLPTSAKIDIWRQQVIAGTITDEDLAQALKLLRQDRLAAAERSRAKRTPAAPKRSGEDLLAELEASLKPKEGEDDEREAAGESA